MSQLEVVEGTCSGVTREHRDGHRDSRGLIGKGPDGKLRPGGATPLCVRKDNLRHCSSNENEATKPRTERDTVSPGTGHPGGSTGTEWWFPHRGVVRRFVPTTHSRDHGWSEKGQRTGSRARSSDPPKSPGPDCSSRTLPVTHGSIRVRLEGYGVSPPSPARSEVGRRGPVRPVSDQGPPPATGPVEVTGSRRRVSVGDVAGVRVGGVRLGRRVPVDLGVLVRTLTSRVTGAAGHATVSRGRTRDRAECPGTRGGWSTRGTSGGSWPTCASSTPTRTPTASTSPRCSSSSPSTGRTSRSCWYSCGPHRPPGPSQRRGGGGPPRVSRPRLHPCPVLTRDGGWTPVCGPR